MNYNFSIKNKFYIYNKNQNQFKLFPPTKLKSLRNTGKTIKFLTCNLQMAPVAKNVNIFKQNKSNLKELLLNPTVINLKNEINFYTGLKQYYKINIKKDILSKFFVENKKNLIILNKQTNERTSFYSGDLIYPIKDNYNFVKRRFVLNLRRKKTSLRFRRRRRKSKTFRTKIKNQFVVKRFIKIVKRLNAKEIITSIRKLRKLKKLPIKKLSFYLKYVPPTYPGRNYIVLGLQGFFHHYKKWYHRLKYYGYVGKRFYFNTTLNDKFLQFFYFFKNYKNRLFYLKRFLLTSFINQNLSLLEKQKLVKTVLFVLIKELIYIKLFLQRFFAFKMFSFKRTKKKIIFKRLKKRLKFNLLFYKKIKKIYQNVFFFLFNNVELNFSSLFNATFIKTILKISKANATGINFKKFNAGLLTNKKRKSLKKKARYRGKRSKKVINIFKSKNKKRIKNLISFSKKVVQYNLQKNIQLKALFDNRALKKIDLPRYFDSNESIVDFAFSSKPKLKSINIQNVNVNVDKKLIAYKEKKQQKYNYKEKTYKKNGIKK